MVDGSKNDWVYSLELSGSRFHNRVGGRGFRDRIFFREESRSDRIPNTGYDAAAAGLRLGYSGMQDHDWEISASHSRQMDAPRPDGYAENTDNKNLIDRYFDPQALTYLHVRDRLSMG